MGNRNTIFDQFREKYGERGYTSDEVYQVLYDVTGDIPPITPDDIREYAKKNGLAINLKTEGFKGVWKRGLYLIKQSDIEKLVSGMQIDVSKSKLENAVALIGDS